MTLSWWPCHKKVSVTYLINVTLYGFEIIGTHERRAISTGSWRLVSAVSDTPGTSPTATCNDDKAIQVDISDLETFVNADNNGDVAIIYDNSSTDGGAIYASIEPRRASVTSEAAYANDLIMHGEYISLDPATRNDQQSPHIYRSLDLVIQDRVGIENGANFASQSGEAKYSNIYYNPWY